MKNIKLKNSNRDRRKNRNRARIFGTKEKPRLSVFRSNRYTNVQLIDDQSGQTLVSASTRELPKGAKENKTNQAYLLGQVIAEKSAKIGIKAAIFNKGPYLFHGRIKAIAEGARAKGLQV